jgi:hypothetical protein
LSVKIVNPLDIPNWDDRILDLPGYSFFHSLSWARLLSESYGYEPIYVAVFEGKTMTACLPMMEVNSFFTGRRGVSLPFADHCEPLVTDKSQARGILERAVRLGKAQKWRNIEIRGGEKFLPGDVTAGPFYSHTLDLSVGIDQLLRNLRDSTRRNIRKAQREKVIARISTSSESVEEFCRLNAITRRQHGLPPQPAAFFKNVYDGVIAQGFGFTVTATVDNIVVAANLFFSFGDKLMYKYGASDKAFQHLRANNLVMWEAIRWCCDHGFKELCLGRTEREHLGLRQFKSGWGCSEQLAGYFKYDLCSDTFVADGFKVNSFYKKFFSKTPIPLLSMMGKVLYRHMG